MVDRGLAATIRTIPGVAHSSREIMAVTIVMAVVGEIDILSYKGCRTAHRAVFFPICENIL